MGLHESLLQCHPPAESPLLPLPQRDLSLFNINSLVHLHPRLCKGKASTGSRMAIHLHLNPSILHHTRPLCSLPPAPDEKSVDMGTPGSGEAMPFLG